MMCGGDREKGEVALEEQWDYVNLNDFKSESCWPPFSYFFVWVFLLISIAVYGVDTFTAVNLLVFSRWSGKVQPAIPFNISRWIFAACIIASFIILAYRWFNAISAMRSGSITRSFLDPLAVRVQSVRPGKQGRGYRRFLVFAELTKDRKAAEYIGLFAYFSFRSCLITIFADGPRQVINAITLYSVMQMDLIPGGKNAHDDGSSSISQFFNNVKILAEENNNQAFVLFGMLFTLIIWAFSVLRLISAVVLYVIFLNHHIPTSDKNLSGYCRRKVTSRLKRIVHRKNTKALAKGLKLRDRLPTQPSLPTFDSTPTLPSTTGDKGLSRSTTQTTLPPYSRSNSSTAPFQNPTLPNLDFDPKSPPARTATSSSVMSESASLTGNAAGMGYSDLDSQQPTLPPVPPLPDNVPSRMVTPHSRATPASYGNEIGHIGQNTGYRNLTDDSSESRPYRTYTPAPEYSSADPAGSEDNAYLNRGHTSPQYDPYGPRGAPPFNQQHDHYHQDPYSTRSYTPASTGGTPVPSRSYTPASYMPTRTPAASVQPAPRTFTPMSSTIPAPQYSEYAAFNPPMPSQTPHPRSQIYPDPSNYNRAQTVSPSAMRRSPPDYSVNRSNTHHN